MKKKHNFLIYLQRHVVLFFMCFCMGLALPSQNANFSTDDGIVTRLALIRPSEIRAPIQVVESSLSEKLESGMKSTVLLLVKKTRESKEIYYGMRGGGPPSHVYAHASAIGRDNLSGSGFIVESSGKLFVMTALHLVERASDNAGSISAMTVDGDEYALRMFCADAVYDLAILAFEEANPRLDPLEFRDSEKFPVRVGEPVYAIGNPLGEFPWSISDGIISGVDRNLGGVTGRFPFYQTTAPILPGNSGGPMLDRNGKVTGMIAQIASRSNGSPVSEISFALSGSTCQRLLDEMVGLNAVQRVWLGMQLEAVEKPSSAPHQVDWRNTPVVLRDVMSTSPARQVLEPLIGWHLVQVDHKRIKSLDEAFEALEFLKPGVTAQFIFEYNDQRDSIDVAPPLLKKEDLVGIANQVLLAPKNVSGTLHLNNPVVINVDGRYWNENDPLSKKCFVLQAGVLTANQSYMYETMRVEELGAAMQLFGMQRAIDLLVVPVDQKNDTDAIRAVVVPFGGSAKENSQVPTLFF